jgi:hypothetical protein
MIELDTVREYVAQGLTTFLFNRKGLFLLFLPQRPALAGRCPMCSGAMDETGCRVTRGPWADFASGIPWAVEIHCDHAKVHE